MLLLLQSGFALLSTVDVAFMGAALGAFAPLLPTLALNGAGAVFLLVLVAGLGRRSRFARRLVVAVQALVLLTAVADLVLAILLAGGALGLVPLLTRVLLPIAVIVLLRRTAER